MKTDRIKAKRIDAIAFKYRKKKKFSSIFIFSSFSGCRHIRYHCCQHVTEYRLLLSITVYSDHEILTEMQTLHTMHIAHGRHHLFSKIRDSRC